MKEVRKRSKVSELSAGPNESISKNTLQEGMTLDAAVAHVKSIDTKASFDSKDDMASSLPSVASSVAACVIRFSAADSPARDWAWEILARTEAMTDNPETYGGSIVPWHPKRRLVIAVFHDRRSDAPRADSVGRLAKLTLHPLNVVSELAFEALFADKDELVRWIAFQLAMRLCVVHSGEFKDDGWDHSANEKSAPTPLQARWPHSRKKRRARCQNSRPRGPREERTGAGHARRLLAYARSIL